MKIVQKTSNYNLIQIDNHFYLYYHDGTKIAKVYVDAIYFYSESFSKSSNILFYFEEFDELKSHIIFVRDYQAKLESETKSL